MNNRRHFIINDVSTWFFANKEYNFNFKDVVYTEDSYVYELLRSKGFTVRVPSQEMDIKGIRRCEDLALKLAKFLKAELNRPSESSTDNVCWGNVLNLGFAYFVSTVLTRACELEFVLSKGEQVIIPYLAGDDQNKLNGTLLRLTHIRCNYYGLLVQFMRERHDRLIDNRVALKALPQAFGDIRVEGFIKQERISVFKKLCCRGLSILSGDVKVLEEILCRHLRQYGTLGRACWDRTWFILGGNRMINSLVIPLLLSGVRLRYLDPGKSKDEDGPVRRPRSDREGLARALCDWAAASEVSEIMQGGMKFVVQRTEAYIEQLNRSNQVLSREVKSHIPDESGVILSLSTHAHQAALFYENIRNTRWRMFCFTDGASGLNHCDRYIEQFSDKGMCHGYVTHNRHDEEFYRQLHSDQNQPIYNYYFFSQLQPYWGWLSRQLGRILLKQSIRERLVVYAPTRFKADHRSVKGDFKDITYWQFMKKLVLNVLNTLDVQVFIKTYGKELYPGQMNRDVGEAGHPLQLLKLNNHVKVQSYPRLNYMMHTADILVIDRATSTLQAALAAERPVVFVNNPSHPLDASIISIIDRSLFLVDAHRNGWQERLRRLLSLPASELNAEWASKHQDREYFKQYYVFGEAGSKKHLIRWISETKDIP